MNNSIGAIAGSHASATALQDGNILSPAVTDFLNAQPAQGGTKPKAYLSWILFDEQFKVARDASGSLMASGYSGVLPVGSSEEFKVYNLPDVPINKNGYLYIYLSNETPNIDVFFDNLQVTHTRGPLLEETQYYPLGLPMAGISSKAASSLENKIKFQGQELNDDLGIDYYEFKWRTHDPQIGRFIQIDPLADKYRSNSVYAFSENKVTGHREFEGLEAVSVNSWTVQSDEVERGLTSWNCNCRTQQTAQASYNNRRKINGETFNIGADGLIINDKIVVSNQLQSNESGKLSNVYGIVLHRTQGSNVSGAVAAMKAGGLGVHFIIDKDGTITQLASLNSWLSHVGKPKHSDWKYRSTTTIGIEHVGVFDEESGSWEALTSAQIESSAWLVKSLMKTYNISAFDVVNHEDIRDKTAGEGSTIRNSIWETIKVFNTSSQQPANIHGPTNILTQILNQITPTPAPPPPPKRGF